MSPACVSFIKIGDWIKVHFFPFLFIVDLAKGVIVLKFIEGLQFKRLHVRMIDLRRDRNF